MFSVIIPLYNKGAYVEKAIRSVAAQTFQDFELIVVDDGSTDDSLHNAQFIIQNLELQDPDQSKKIQLIQQKNQGVSTARNNGVKLAKYDYIAFLDADDWWEPDYLSEMKALIEAYPEAGIYGSSYYKVKNGRNIPANIGVEPGFKSGLINYFQVYAATFYMPLTSITSIIKKNIYIDLKGFKEELKLGEDFDLWVRVAMEYPVAFLNKPLAYYNQDVEQENRAIGAKLYEPSEHMLFSDYNQYQTHKDFIYLYEVLALYGLMPYYLSRKNENEVDFVLKKIHWNRHPFKYYLFYKVFPRKGVLVYFRLKSKLYQLLKTSK